MGSTWYYGKYYGTYVSVRIISKLFNNHSSLEKTMGFLMKTHNSNGSWGEKQGNPTDTSLALMTLTYLFEIGMYIDEESVIRSIQYLHLNQDKSGKWMGSDFIKIDTGRVTKYPDSQILTYQSDTVCTTT